MSSATPAYKVRGATQAGDVQDILDFFDAEASGDIRRLARDEVEQLVVDGLFYVARSGIDGRIVATTYLSRQRTDRGDTEYEIGGGLVAHGHRRAGLMECLGVCAIAAQRIATMPPSGGRPLPIVGRVGCSNSAPIRPLLAKLGFKALGQRSMAAGSKPGLQHMPQDASGGICIEEFEFDDATLPQLLQQVLDYRQTGLLPGRPERVVVEIDILLADPTGDPLQDLLGALRGP